MSGAIRHMKRSHRSYSKKNNQAVYNDFHRKAKLSSYKKEQRKALEAKRSFSIKDLGKSLTAMIKGGK